MDEATVRRLLTVEPFRSINAGAFQGEFSLAGMLLHDCRILSFEQGDIVVREGDYGGSAFLILRGSVLVSLASLPQQLLGRRTTRPRGWLRAISQLWKQQSTPAARSYAERLEAAADVGVRLDGPQTRVFLQDIPRVMTPGETAELHAGEIFGELAAWTRGPRSATVVAKAKTLVLEIRGEAFRELVRRNQAWQNHVEKLYRERSLVSHLQGIDLFRRVSDETLQLVANEIVFESFGNDRAPAPARSVSSLEANHQIQSEPPIAGEGEYVNGLVLIRYGHARVSRMYGAGHQTISYQGKGSVFGLRELAHNWKHREQRPWSVSLRAIGSVDILRVPVSVMEKYVLPTIPAAELPDSLPVTTPEATQTSLQLRDESAEFGPASDPRLLEFLIDHQLIGGTQAMLIDLERCTRCDDCIGACAATHNGVARFRRQGPKHERWMVAGACMHCVDPVCMAGCPTGAIGREPQSGAILINDATCIGCSVCADNCPYDNIQMVATRDSAGENIVEESSGKPLLEASHCDLCRDQPGGPACQNACPHDALVRIDLTNPHALRRKTIA